MTKHRVLVVIIAAVVLTTSILLLFVQSSSDKYWRISSLDILELSPLANTSAMHGTSGEIACSLPQLLVDDPSIRKFIIQQKPLSCSSVKNWVSTQNGLVFATEEAQKKYPGMRCNHSGIHRKTDTTYFMDNPVEFDVKSKFQLTTDGFRVTCKSGSAKYDNLHVGVVKNEAAATRKSSLNSEHAGLNVLIYPVDSMSRVNFLRKLPNFYKFLMQELDPVDFKGLNIVGDGTPWTMIPMLTGYFQPELPEARKRFKNSSFIDDWPLIFYDYRDAGFVTAFGDEMPQFGFFVYKIKGFKNVPTDHYLQPWEFAILDHKSKHKPYCLGDTPRCEILLEWWMDYQNTYARNSSKKTFALLFAAELSHDDYNLVQSMDDRYVKVFDRMLKSGYLNDTLLILMGDHGRRFGEVRQTQTGRTEEKMPFLTIYAPPWWRKKFSVCWSNLAKNSERLITPFDLHATLKNIVNFTAASCSESDFTARGISLFQEVPKKRTCDDADIHPHFCSCQDWDDVTNTTKARQIASFILNELNNLLEPTGSKCVKLQLNSLLWAKRLSPNKQMLSFKQSKDIDNINPVLNEFHNVTNIFYQIAFVTSPNFGRYEASVLHYKTTDTFKFSPDLISRTNAYSDQPHCIMRTHHQLRPYCICPDMVNKEKKSLIEGIS